MAGLRFTDLQSRPTEFLDFTSLTLEEFQQLAPPFETAFHARMAAWRMEGKPRTARRFPVDKNCPLPTPEDRLLFIFVYLKTYALQVVHGRLFGMVQGKANRWTLLGTQKQLSIPHSQRRGDDVYEPFAQVWQPFDLCFHSLHLFLRQSDAGLIDLVHCRHDGMCAIACQRP